jgi:hypothetical protein
MRVEVLRHVGPRFERARWYGLGVRTINRLFVSLRSMVVASPVSVDVSGPTIGCRAVGRPRGGRVRWTWVSQSFARSSMGLPVERVDRVTRLASVVEPSVQLVELSERSVEVVAIEDDRPLHCSQPVPAPGPQKLGHTSPRISWNSWPSRKVYPGPFESLP